MRYTEGSGPLEGAGSHTETGVLLQRAGRYTEGSELLKLAGIIVNVAVR